MKLQEFQNTVDNLIVLYRHWEFLKRENARLRKALTELAEPILKPEIYNGFPLYAEFLELKCSSLEERVSFFEEQLTEARNKETEFTQALERIVNESFESGESASRAIAAAALEEKE